MECSWETSFFSHPYRTRKQHAYTQQRDFIFLFFCTCHKNPWMCNEFKKFIIKMETFVFFCVLFIIMRISFILFSLKCWFLLTLLLCLKTFRQHWKQKNYYISTRVRELMLLMNWTCGLLCFFLFHKKNFIRSFESSSLSLFVAPQFFLWFFLITRKKNSNFISIYMHVQTDPFLPA